LNQLEAELIDDTAIQLTTARGNERLTATLTDTMHEETQVIKKKTQNLILSFILFVSIYFVYLVFHILSVQQKLKLNVLI
jgi:hypothetical protein